MREWLGNWGYEFVDGDLAEILLAIGLIPVKQRRHDIDLNAVLARQLRRRSPQPLVWRMPDLPSQSGHWSAGLQVDDALAQMRDASDCRVRLMDGGPIELIVWWRYFQANTNPWRSYHMAARGALAQREVRLRWPARVGVVGQQAQALLGELYDRDHWGGAVFQPVPLDRRHCEVEVLVASAPNWGEWYADIADARRRLGTLRADLLLVFSMDSFILDTLTSDLLGRLAGMTGANGVALVRQPDIADEVVQTLVEVSHDQPIDRALWRDGDRKSLLLANESLIRDFRISRRARGFGRALLEQQSALPLEPGLLDGTALNADRIPLEWQAAERGAEAPVEGSRGALGANVLEMVEHAGWLREGDESSALGAVMENLRRADEKAPEERFLQAMLHTAADDAPTMTIRPATDYAVAVRIAEKAEGYISTGTAFPPLEPEQDGNRHTLQVVFWEPELCPTPATQTIELPPVGPSSVARFAVRTGPVTTRLEGRIIVLHKGRVVQSGVIAAGVELELSFDLDTVVRRRLAGLDHRLQFDASFVLNDLGDYPAIYRIVGDKAVALGLDHHDVRALMDRCELAISEITENPQDYTSLRAPGTLRLLRELAARGASFRRYLMYALPGAQALDDPEYLQIVAAKPGKVLPIEFAYQYVAPERDAELCVNAEEALKTGECPMTCARHGQPAKAMRKIVCPLGFWGLRAVIERPKYRPAHSRFRAAYALSAEPTGAEQSTVRPLQSLLVAASNIADNHTPGTVDAAWKALRALSPNAKKVDTWDQWETQVAALSPTLLALLVHQDTDGSGTPRLHIGAGDKVLSDNLYEEHVRAGPDDHPLVLLIGCEVAIGELNYDVFTEIFQMHGASLVVGTMAKVLGREAGPLLQDLAGALNRVTEPTSLGAILRDLRRQLLLDGKPTVLALTAIGDADWVIER